MVPNKSRGRKRRRICWEEELHNCQGESWGLGKGSLEEIKEHAGDDNERAKLVIGFWAANVQRRAMGWVLSAVENQVIIVGSYFLSEEANLMTESERRKYKTFGVNQTKLRYLYAFASIFMSSLKEETSTS